MKNSAKIFVAFGVISLLAISLAAADRFGNGIFFGEDRESLEAEREAARESVENNDYNAWASIMQERVQKMQDRINPEVFEQIQARHTEREKFREEMQEAMESGDYEAMHQLMEKNGFEGRGIGKGVGFRHGECPMAE